MAPRLLGLHIGLGRKCVALSERLWSAASRRSLNLFISHHGTLCEVAEKGDRDAVRDEQG